VQQLSARSRAAMTQVGLLITAAVLLHLPPLQRYAKKISTLMKDFCHCFSSFRQGTSASSLLAHFSFHSQSSTQTHTLHAPITYSFTITPAPRNNPIVPQLTRPSAKPAMSYKQPFPHTTQMTSQSHSAMPIDPRAQPTTQTTEPGYRGPDHQPPVRKY
jgi:hypothetical protein